VRIKFKTGQSGKKSKSNLLLPFATLIGGSLIGAAVAFSLIDVPANQQTENAAASTEQNAATKTASSDQTADTAGSDNPADTRGEKGQSVRAKEPVIKTVSVGKGDTLMKVLTRAGAGSRESYEAITALSKIYNPRQLRIGQDITLNFHPHPIEEATSQNGDGLKLFSVSLQQDVDREVSAYRKEEQGFEAKENVIALDKVMSRAGGTIENSLFLSATQSGIPTKVILNMIRMFSYDVDFQRQIQTGDKFEVYFERFVDAEGRSLKTGKIYWASMTLSGTNIALYQYKTKDDGFTDYYAKNGQSVRKTLMRTPIDGARLTSRFGKRKHPILGYTKMHRGADFGAGRGTPIMAAGNGTIEMAARNGAYGNYVRIRHTSEYKTAYAHMKGFAKNIRKGKRVKQGQIIGYVGTTGRSTGPHLHYEVLKNGRQINPLSVKLPAGRKLKGKVLTSFKRYTDQMDKEMAAIPLTTKVASLSQ
jgi:murein DD-endopeptidase MepM/ murein hydrolase activator NlpD